MVFSIVWALFKEGLAAHYVTQTSCTEAPPVVRRKLRKHTVDAAGRRRKMTAYTAA